MAEKTEENTEQLFQDIDLTSIEDMSDFLDDNAQKNDENDVDTNNDTKIDNDTKVGDSDDAVDDNKGETNNLNDDSKDESSSSQDVDDNSSLYTAVARLLVEEGALHPFQEDTVIKSSEDLVNLYNKQMESKIEEYKNGLDPRAKWLVENLEDGVPLDSLLKIDRDKLELNNITEDNIASDKELQRNVLRTFYKRTTRFSDDKIEREINNFDDLGILEEESKSTLNDLRGIVEEDERVNRENAKKEALANLKAQQEALDNFKSKIESTKEIIPGLALTDIMKDKVFKTMTTKVGVDSYGNPINEIGKARINDPIGFDFNLAYIYKLTNGFKNWNVFNIPGKKNAIKELEEAAGRLDLQKNYSSKNDRKKSADSKDILNSMDFFR